MLWLAWILYLAGHVANHLAVRWMRRGGGQEVRVVHDRSSDAGLALQLAGIGIALVFQREPEALKWLAPIGLALLYGGVGLTWLSLAYLRDHWRASAVLTEDHELVTAGPYRVLRHPVYTALLAMLAGSILLISQWWAGALAVIAYVAGTEIRIAVEDRILAAHFGEEFARYKRQTAAWLPPAR